MITSTRMWLSACFGETASFALPRLVRFSRCRISRRGRWWGWQIRRRRRLSWNWNWSCRIAWRWSSRSLLCLGMWRCCWRLGMGLWWWRRMRCRLCQCHPGTGRFRRWLFPVMGGLSRHLRMMADWPCTRLGSRRCLSTNARYNCYIQCLER